MFHSASLHPDHVVLKILLMLENKYSLTKFSIKVWYLSCKAAVEVVPFQDMDWYLIFHYSIITEV